MKTKDKTDTPLTFAQHKEKTAEDCEGVAELLTELAKTVREGNLKAFEEFWWEGGTEEGDAKVLSIREIILLRYVGRQDAVKT